MRECPHVQTVKMSMYGQQVQDLCTLSSVVCPSGFGEQTPRKIGTISQGELACRIIPRYGLQFLHYISIAARIVISGIPDIILYIHNAKIDL